MGRSWSLAPTRIRCRSTNSTTSEMAVVSAQSNVFGIINDTSHVNVIGLVHMSAADYAAFSGPHYIA